jgi:hypothetical protein
MNGAIVTSTIICPQQYYWCAHMLHTHWPAGDASLVELHPRQHN